MARLSSGIFLKRNNHHESLASLLYSQLEKENFVDVTIAAEGKFVNAHSLILCASSTYFEVSHNIVQYWFLHNDAHFLFLQELLGQHHKPSIIILQNVKFCDVQSIIEVITILFYQFSTQYLIHYFIHILIFSIFTRAKSLCLGTS